MHILPQLRKLERKYAGELAVVGVHSAKFTAEQNTHNLRKAVLRHEIEHPVVNDREFEVWKQYSVHAWPTLVLLDPKGQVIGKHAGEFALNAFDRVIAELVERFDHRGLIDRRPLHFRLEREKERERTLSFPGKVLADAASNRLFVADSNHNRLLVSSLDGSVVDVVGSGERGLADGGYAAAAFDGPQGMALQGDVLYVADTGNHAVRGVDLAAKTVQTVAGVGEQATTFHRGGHGPTAALNSPWDLVLHNRTLYIAMAGFHQLWGLDLATLEVRPHAGSGRERIVDGPLEVAQLAQPSGIAAHGDTLYFTDSETSAIRTADTSSGGSVATIVGLHLFTFGDVDGVGDEVRLQHPLGIDIDGGVLFIADTYNNKVKRVFPKSREAETFLGSGKPGHCDGPGDLAEFHEPGGLAVAGGTLYVADTNNHAIRVAGLRTREVETLNIKGL